MKRVIRDIEEAASANANRLCLDQLEIIKKWRIGKIAPIDVYGCDRLADCMAEPKVNYNYNLN
jgi:hypothetical protein